MSAARPSVILAAHRAAVLGTAQRLGARNVRVFGSIARGEDTERSDIDLAPLKGNLRRRDDVSDLFGQESGVQHSRAASFTAAITRSWTASSR